MFKVSGKKNSKEIIQVVVRVKKQNDILANCFHFLFFPCSLTLVLWFSLILDAGFHLSYYFVSQKDCFQCSGSASAMYLSLPPLNYEI